LIKTIQTGHAGYILSLAVLRNGYLASASQDRNIKIWNTDTSSLIRTLTGHTSYVYALTVLPNGNLASGCGDFTIKIWN
jgi:phospholipase A-2-activating protein